MPNYAQATLVGHLGRDPELKSLPSGEQICTFNIATTRKRKTGDITTWWKCTVWGKQSETITRYFKKGDPILVTGEPFHTEWTDKEGTKRVTLEMNVAQFTFIRSAKDAATDIQDTPAHIQPVVAATETTNHYAEEDIPF